MKTFVNKIVLNSKLGTIIGWKIFKNHWNTVKADENNGDDDDDDYDYVGDEIYKFSEVQAKLATTPTVSQIYISDINIHESNKNIHE